MDCRAEMGAWWRRTGLVVSLALLGNACGEEGPSLPRPREARLPEGIVARVADETLSTSFVRSVAEARDVSLPAARDAVVSEALFAAGARESMGDQAVIGALRRSVLAQALLDQVRQRAAAGGPPSASELAALKSRHWMDLDRPISVQVAHAVALVTKPGDAGAARTLADEIAAATRGIEDPKLFTKEAKRHRAPGIETRVETLPFVARDGRAVYFDPSDPKRKRNTTFNAAFVEAAHAIEDVGQHSPVTKTSFGYHVILLIERVEAQRVPDAKLVETMSDEVRRLRAERELEQLLERLRGVTPVEVSRNFQSLSELVPVSP